MREPNQTNGWQIGQLAKLAGVTARTLRHYEKMGLLAPTVRLDNNYRVYGQADLYRLQQIIIHRELGFSLQDVKKILDHPGFDLASALKKQQQLLLQKQELLDKQISSLSETLRSLEKDTNMDANKMFAGFDYQKIQQHQKQYKQEAKKLYGKSDAWQQSQKRTGNYSEEDWKQIHADAKRIYSGLAQLMDKPVSNHDVQRMIQEWFKHISKYYYDCNLEIFAGLAQTYIADERFEKNIDQTRAGLAQFMSEAMLHFCKTQA